MQVFLSNKSILVNSVIFHQIRTPVAILKVVSALQNFCVIINNRGVFFNKPIFDVLNVSFLSYYIDPLDIISFYTVSYSIIACLVCKVMVSSYLCYFKRVFFPITQTPWILFLSTLLVIQASLVWFIGQWCPPPL